MKYIKILMFAGILSAASACTTDEINSDSIFKSGDLRGAIQLPADVISAGLEPNPRENTNEKK